MDEHIARQSSARVSQQTRADIVMNTAVQKTKSSMSIEKRQQQANERFIRRMKKARGI